jgi:hypothetical protein
MKKQKGGGRQGETTKERKNNRAGEEKKKKTSFNTKEQQPSTPCTLSPRPLPQRNWYLFINTGKIQRNKSILGCPLM